MTALLTLQAMESSAYPIPRTFCGAKTRTGGRCKQPAMANGKCRLHGGKSLSGKQHGEIHPGGQGGTASAGSPNAENQGDHGPMYDATTDHGRGGPVHHHSGAPHPFTYHPQGKRKPCLTNKRKFEHSKFNH